MIDERFHPTSDEQVKAWAISASIDLNTTRALRHSTNQADTNQAISVLEQLVNAVADNTERSSPATRVLAEVCRQMRGLPRGFIIRNCLVYNRNAPTWVRLSARNERTRLSPDETSMVLGLVGAPMSFEALWKAWPGSYNDHNTNLRGLHTQLGAAHDLARVCRTLAGDDGRLEVVRTLRADGIDACRIGQLDEIARVIVTLT